MGVIRSVKSEASEDNLVSTKVAVTVTDHFEFDLVDMFGGQAALYRELFGNADPNFTSRFKEYFDGTTPWGTAAVESLFEYLVDKYGSFDDVSYEFILHDSLVEKEVSVSAVSDVTKINVSEAEEKLWMFR